MKTYEPKPYRVVATMDFEVSPSHRQAQDIRRDIDRVLRHYWRIGPYAKCLKTTLEKRDG